MTDSAEALLLFELFDAKPRTKRLRALTGWFYTMSVRTHLITIFEWLGDRTDDFCRWDLMRQYHRHLESKEVES